MDANVEIFTQLRPIFYIILGFLGVCFILSLIPRGRDSKINMLSVVIVSITHLVFASALLVTENWILTEWSLKGDPITFYLYIATFVLSILNPVVFYFRNKEKRRSSYSFR